MSDISIAEKAWAFVTAGGLWLTGEVGRVVLSGAAGGLVRWLSQERKRLRDGLFAVMVGVPSAFYIGPLVPVLLRHAGFKIADAPDMDVTFGFLAGLGGMSLAKLSIALLEGRLRKTEADK